MSKGSRSFKFIFSMVRSLTHRNTISIVKTWFLTCIVLVICKLIISFYSILSIFLFTKIKIISADINSFIMVRNPTSLAEGVIFWFTSVFIKFTTQGRKLLYPLLIRFSEIYARKLFAFFSFSTNNIFSCLL